VTDARGEGRRSIDQSLRAILAAIADGVVVVDRDGIVCFANPAAEAMFGRTSVELVSHQFGFPLVAGATTELELLARSGQSSTVEMRVAATEWEGESAWLASLRDITGRKRAEAQRVQLVEEQAARREAELALQARDEFLAVAAHELKTPITRLRLSTQRALRRAEVEGLTLPPLVADALALVDRESDHIDRLVTQLLDLSRMENGTLKLNPTATELRELVRAAVARVQGQVAQPGLELRMADQPVVARVDRRIFEQVVIGLIANAVRYSPPESTVLIEVDRKPGGQHACVVVRDHATMAGVEYRPGLFDGTLRAVQSYFSGTGIGLYVSRRLIELHGGEVSVERVGESGARIVVTVPLEA
jgi:signal transduction histidine kinase